MWIIAHSKMDFNIRRIKKWDYKSIYNCTSKDKQEWCISLETASLTWYMSMATAILVLSLLRQHHEMTLGLRDVNSFIHFLRSTPLKMISLILFN